MLDLRGSVLGRLGSGTLRVTDHTPADRYVALVVGRKLTQERVRPRTVLYRGHDLRFRMLGGAYRIVFPEAYRRFRSGTWSGRRRPKGDGRGHGCVFFRRSGLRAQAQLCTSSDRTAALWPGIDRATLAGDPVTTTRDPGRRGRTSIASFVAAYLRNAGYTVNLLDGSRGLDRLAGERRHSSCSTSICPMATASALSPNSRAPTSDPDAPLGTRTSTRSS
jgi:hypothetical protein